MGFTHRWSSLVDLGCLFLLVAGGGGEGGWAGLGGADAWFGFCEVDLYGLLTGGAIPGGIGVVETRPGGEFFGFDSSEPGGFDWKSSGGVEVADEGPNAGEVVSVEGSQGCRSKGIK